MTDFKDYADELQQEVVTDMAETYFGARKDIDDMLEVFDKMVGELRRHEPLLSQAAARLALPAARQGDGRGLLRCPGRGPVERSLYG